MRARFHAVLAAACAACGGSGEGGGAVPAMRVSASSLSFAANAGSLTVLSQSVQVTNGGGGVLPTPIFDIAYASGSG